MIIICQQKQNTNEKNKPRKKDKSQQTQSKIDINSNVMKNKHMELLPVSVQRSKYRVFP